MNIELRFESDCSNSRAARNILHRLVMSHEDWRHRTYENERGEKMEWSKKRDKKMDRHGMALMEYEINGQDRWMTRVGWYDGHGCGVDDE